VLDQREWQDSRDGRRWLVRSHVGVPYRSSDSIAVPSVLTFRRSRDDDASTTERYSIDCHDGCPLDEMAEVQIQRLFDLANNGR
jgi:hypothetical protein